MDVEWQWGMFECSCLKENARYTYLCNTDGLLMIKIAFLQTKIENIFVFYEYDNHTESLNIHLVMYRGNGW